MAAWHITFSRWAGLVAVILVGVRGVACGDAAWGQGVNVPWYAVGDIVESNIITPLALTVSDRVATEGLKEQLRRELVPVFRFAPRAADQSVVELRADFQRNRSRFVTRLQGAYGRPALNGATVNHSSFARFVGGLRKEFGDFPLEVDLAGLWALGGTGEQVADRWIGRLRAAMEQFICPEPVEETIGEAFGGRISVNRRARVIAINSFERDVSVATVGERGFDRALSEFGNIGAVGEREADPVMRYVVGFMRPNCLLDVALSRAVQEHSIARASVAKHFKAGEIIAAEGEAVDAVAQEALAGLREHWAREKTSRELAESRREQWRRFVAGIEGRLATAGSMAASYPWAFAACGIGLLWLVWRRRRKGRPLNTSVVVRHGESALLPDPREAGVISVKGAGSADESGRWPMEVMEAERRAEELLAEVRGGLAPELARRMMDKLVQELLAQRKALLTTHALAVDQISALEQRFEKVHSKLRERLIAYEERAATLEDKLDIKDRENSHLLRAMVEKQRRILD